MVMSRQLRTAAASLTTTADRCSARCHMPNHARDPPIDHSAPLMAWRAATAIDQTGRPPTVVGAAPLHRCRDVAAMGDADSATPLMSLVFEGL